MMSNQCAYLKTNTLQKLVKGSLVLGQISRVNNLDLEVALPNNLTGHVSIAAISDQLTARLESDLKAEDDDEESSDETDIDLASMYTTGQWVRVHVESTRDDAEIGKAKKRIELSLRPSETNTGLEKDDIVTRGTLMAAVVSVEDHGCVMDIGVAGMGAFLPKSEIDPSIDEDRLQPGAVFLTSVTGTTGGKVAQVSLLEKKLSNVKAAPEAKTINTFLPGTAVDLLVTNNEGRGLAGKILGHLDATADLIHSGIGPAGVDLESTYKVGTRAQARVICNFPTAQELKLGISLLPHVKTLSAKMSDGRKGKLPTEALPISTGVKECKVTHVEPAVGLFIDLGVPGLKGFVHISRVKDGKIDALYQSSGPYQIGSTHEGRIIGYNPIDGLFQVSFEKSVLARTYIRIEDVPVGAVVDCEIQKTVVKEDGMNALILKVTEGITGLVTEQHFSDIRLQHPEKKFRVGVKVKARVLSVDPARKQIRLTMKKTLVNSEAPVIKSYNEAEVGMQVPGTIMRIQPQGADIKFYGSLKGYLPISEMSEAYIRDPTDHFRRGQVISVHILDVDPERRRLIVSCKDPAAFGLEKQNALKALKLGDIVSAKVSQKTEDDVFVELEGSGLKAVLPAAHLTDKTTSRNQQALKRIHAGQTLTNLLIIDKDDKRRAIVLSQKPSFIAAAKDGKLLTSFESAQPGMIVPGFVKNITQTAVFVQFAGTLHALLPRSRLPADLQSQPDFGMTRLQTLEVKIVSTIPDLKRILVAPASVTDVDETKPKGTKAAAAAPTDGLTQGSVVQATLGSIKDTQINVHMGDSDVQGRIDISQIFDSWDDIADHKQPLAKFKKLTPGKSKLNVKVLGVRSSKDHRFLPFSHRSLHSVLELTSKPSALQDDSYEPLTLDKVKVGESYVAFVNNTSPAFLWVSLSPAVRGRISAMDASNDISQLSDLETNFPVGTALRVKVKAVDHTQNRLDLTARSSDSETITWKTLKTNMVLPGVITKVNERQVLVKLSETVSGPVHLPDMVDNYDEVNTHNYKKGEVVRVSIVSLDVSNKTLRLSTRPSRIMSSTLPVNDREITNISQLTAGDVVRGFVKNVADKGLFVLLGGPVTAMVKISNLSDRFIKEWKDQYQVDQLVKGRVVSVNSGTKQVELSLKASALDENYVAPTTYESIREGQIVTGHVRKVETFGAFIVLDDSANVSGLAHRSQMADKAVVDATKLYQEGDKVKALVLEVDAPKRKISLGLKPSFFDDDDDEDMDSDEEGAALELGADDDSGEDEDMEGGVDIKLLGLDADSDEEMDDDEEDEEEDDEDEEDEDEDEDDDEEIEASSKSNGLTTGKKSAWTEDPFAEAGSDGEAAASSKKSAKKDKKKKAEVQVDRTAELDVNGPQTASDYERLLLGQPDSSELWIAYMAFQMQVSELSKAREVAERAIKSINIREEAEKLNVWIAYLNLEVAYGNKHTVEEVFKRAAQYNNEQEVYERLASIYIQSEKHKVSLWIRGLIGYKY